MTPATLGPIACISRKLWGLDSSPTLLDTRAAMGTAETPAEPINGLIGCLLMRLSSLAISTPQAVPMAKATMPSPRMPRVSTARKRSAISLEPTDSPRKMVTMLIRAFCAVSESRSTTPHSRIRLPKQNIPSSGAASGRNNTTRISSASGNTIFSSFDTGRSWVMAMLRSFWVVNAFMIGGWINGTSAM